MSGNSDKSRNNIITGDLLILAAQVITAFQMVYEEKYVAGMDIPALQGKNGKIKIGMKIDHIYYV